MSVDRYCEYLNDILWWTDWSNYHSCVVVVWVIHLFTYNLYIVSCFFFQWNVMPVRDNIDSSFMHDENHVSTIDMNYGEYLSCKKQHVLLVKWCDINSVTNMLLIFFSKLFLDVRWRSGEAWANHVSNMLWQIHTAWKIYEERRMRDTQIPNWETFECKWKTHLCLCALCAILLCDYVRRVWNRACPFPATAVDKWDVLTKFQNDFIMYKMYLRTMFLDIIILDVVVMSFYECQNYKSKWSWWCLNYALPYINFV